MRLLSGLVKPVLVRHIMNHWTIFKNVYYVSNYKPICLWSSLHHQLLQLNYV